MPVKTVREASNEALHPEMARVSNVIVPGEDVPGGAGGSSGQRVWPDERAAVFVGL